MSGADIRLVGLQGIPEVNAGDDVAALILDALAGEGPPVAAGDVFVVTQKIVSKAEGRLVRLDDVVPSPAAIEWAEKWGRNPRVVQLVLREARRIVRMERGVLIVETSHGFVCANAGVDESNVPRGMAALLPEDPDASAARIRARLCHALGVPVGVIISDTFGRPWREGVVDIAIGVAGIRPFSDYRGQSDDYGHRLQSTVIATADELAAAGELVMGKLGRIPVALIRGAAVVCEDGTGQELVRREQDDLFR